MAARVTVLLVLLARAAFGADCSGFPDNCDLSATITTLSRTGIKIPDDCYCPYEDPLNDNWNNLNTNFCKADVECSLRATLRVFSTLGTPADGTLLYCDDCNSASPCGSGGDGALARRENGVWNCGAGAGGSRDLEWVIEEIAAGDDDYVLSPFSAGTTLVEVACHASGTTTTPATLAFENTAGNPVPLTGGGDLTASTGTSAASFTTFATSGTNSGNRVFTKGQRLRFDVTNTPSAGQRVACTVARTVP